MRRCAFLVLLSLLIFVALLAGPAEATRADVFTITGGSAEQQSVVRGALEESTWDWSWGAIVPTPLTFAEDNPPYWGGNEWAPMLHAAGEIAFPYYVAGAVGGVSYWPSGRIIVNASITDASLLRQIAMHEGAHARVMFQWFWLPGGMDGNAPLLAWRQLTAVGNPGDWHLSPIEHHAEWFRVTYLDPALQYNQGPTTRLPAPPNGTADVIAFHDEWAPRDSPEPPYPFSDIQPGAYGVDQELLDASVWAVEQGIFEGYDDGSFGVFRPALKRHVALVAQRAGLSCPSAWLTDYGVATRGEVRDAIPLTWNDTRWDEAILRSQLLRLLWRER